MPEASETEYRLKFFDTNNYFRKICKSCHTPFWTKKENEEYCSDIPCTDYYFFEIPIKSGPLTVREARRKFIDFFARKGHTPIPPKPVLARWREDLYLTIASIVDFQPHVTSGLVPPPANPLVISQPCIRLEDVDNVGVTLGRHLTSFEMAAHHAFNYPDKFVYWKDETVELAKEFFTEEIGIPEEELHFKESWWEGGGNAGPSFEVTVGGLELATLVFMQYSVQDGTYVPLKLRIVDTGYGVERIAWFTQRTPTAFHAIYGDLVYRFYKAIGVEPIDDNLLRVAARYAGRLDPDNPSTVRLHRELVAKELGMKVEDVDSELTRAARVFQVLDHTKTIALMLSDGLVPSNSGEGYLGRLLIRRTLRVLKLLKSDVDLRELIKMQIDYWAEDFPNMLKNKEYILDVIENEQAKFEEVLLKAPSVAQALAKRQITLDTLIEAYDSNGIPPDILAEELKKVRKDVNVEVPHNFYALVAKRHQTSPIKGKERQKVPQEVSERVRTFQPTRKLYYEDQYLRRFTAKLLGVVNGKYIILDQTAFYPEGGGQVGDTGTLYIGTKQVRIVDTQKVGDVVVHVAERPVEAPPGTEVVGEIDWQRRYRIMRHHTATHVVLQAAKRVLGDHVWQAGAEKTEEKARLDITHYKTLSSEEIRKIEDLANSVVLDRRPVRVVYMGRTEAENKYGVSIYAGGVPETATVRLLEIQDWDVEGCGGTHLTNTSEIGGIKIINVEKIQDGVIRLEFVAGDVIAKYSRELENEILTVSDYLGTTPAQLEIRSRKLVEQLESLEGLVKQYRETLLKAPELVARKDEINGVSVYWINDLSDSELVKELMRRLTQAKGVIVVSTRSLNEGLLVEVATSKDVKVDKLVAKLRELGGKGGGSGTFASVNVKNGKREDVIEAIKSTIKAGL
jgi:alanyl-tRNA synthetase